MVDRLAVVGSVGGDAGDLALDLPEQGRQLAGVIGPVVGQHAGDDLAGVGVHGQVQLAPGPARPAVLLRVALVQRGAWVRVGWSVCC